SIPALEIAPGLTAGSIFYTLQETNFAKNGNIGPGEEVKKSERRPRLAEFFDLSSDCGLVLCTKHSRPYCPCQAIRGQTEYFRANAARKYLVSPRIADCAPGLAAGFDSFTVSCPRIAPKDQIPTASLRAATGP